MLNIFYYYFSLTGKMTLFKLFGTNLKITTKIIHMTTRYKTKNYNAVYTKLYEINALKLVFPLQQFHRKYCFHSFRGDETDSDSEDIEQKRDIKSTILQDNNDMLAIKISECKSLQEIFDLLQNNKNKLNWKNISMAIAMVRELQIVYYRVCMFEKNLNSYITPEYNFENILTNNDFLNLINLIEEHYEFMNIQCLSYSLLCLHKIGVDINSTISLKLSHKLQKILMITPVEEIESCILSRFIVTIVSHRNLLGLYILKDIWPIILKKMGNIYIHILTKFKNNYFISFMTFIICYLRIM